MRWETEEEADGGSGELPFPVGVMKFLHVLQVIIGLAIVIIHVVCAFTDITLWFLLGGIPGILYIVSGLTGLFLAPADGKHRFKCLMALCVLFWVWALVFPLAYYLAFVYFLYVYDEDDYPIIELCVSFYLMALAEGFISMAVFAFSAAAASKPKPSNFKILYDL